MWKSGTHFFKSGYGREKYALDLISPLKYINSGPLLVNKDLKIAITQKATDETQGLFCVHMGVEFQKSAPPILLQFARFRKIH